MNCVLQKTYAYKSKCFIYNTYTSILIVLCAQRMSLMCETHVEFYFCIKNVTMGRSLYKSGR